MSQIVLTQINNGDQGDAIPVMSNFNALKNRLNLGVETDNIADGAVTNIKLTKITAPGKVSGSSLIELPLIPVGAGVIPAANLPVGFGGSGGMNSARNIAIAYGSASTVTLAVDYMLLEDTSFIQKTVRSMSVTVSSATAGNVNTLDTGTVLPNLIYYIYVISDGAVDGGLLSLSATTPTLPAGFTYSSLVGCVGTNASSAFIPFRQTGRKYCFTTWATIATGNPGGGVWTAIDLTPANMTTNAGFVPSALSNYCFGTISNGAGVNAGVYISNVNTVGVGGQPAPPNVIEYGVASGGNNSLFSGFWAFDILTADTLYWANFASSVDIVYLAGFEVNKI